MKLQTYENMNATHDSEPPVMMQTKNKELRSERGPEERKEVQIENMVITEDATHTSGFIESIYRTEHGGLSGDHRIEAVYGSSQ